MTASASQLIKICHESQVLLFGEFTLKSGRISPYFINAGLLYEGSQLYALGVAFAEVISASAIQFDVIFGPAYKGISLAAITAVELYKSYGVNVQFSYNRKEKKDHGEGGSLVGAPLKGKRVLVLDDVITAGTAIRDAISIISNEGGQLAGIVESLDRQERGTQSSKSAVQQIEEDTGVKVLAGMTLTQIIRYLEKQPAMEEQLQAVQNCKYILRVDLSRG